MRVTGAWGAWVFEGTPEGPFFRGLCVLGLGALLRTEAPGNRNPRDIEAAEATRYPTIGAEKLE